MSIPRLMTGVLVLSACASYQHPNITGDMNRRTAEMLWKRTEFDFECDRAHIHLTRLAGNQVGAEGCGQRATYVRIDGSVWVMNNGTPLNRAALQPAAEDPASPEAE